MILRRCAMSKKRSGVRHQPKFSLLSISLYPNHGLSEVSGQIILDILDAGLTGMYGVIGGAILSDLVSFCDESSTAIIRCKQRDEARICAASTFLIPYNGSLFQLQTVPSLESSGNLPTDLQE